MQTPKEALWKQYYDLIKRGMHSQARQVLERIHAQPQAQAPRKGGCSRCRKRF